MKTLIEIQKRNYTATVRRGLINPNTSMDDFIDKIQEEWLEFAKDESIDELADIIIVCLNIAEHYNFDILKALKKKTEYNEIRK